MSAHESAIERLNYYNGQRLEAADFRTEQAYHMRVRRWLNKSLYLPGIASGLEVVPHATDPHKVVVKAGLAIDVDGREIILLDPRDVLARGTPTGKNGVVIGNYVVISYAETRTAALQDGCRVDAGAALAGASGGCGCGCGGQGGTGCTCGGAASVGAAGATGLAWGGMTRIRADPVIECQNTWPTKASGKIVLAQLDLNAQCQVANVLSGMRQYTSESKPPKVRNVSLEGEKDIDHLNPKTLYFHIQGGAPDGVFLYLRAAQFSTLYYTELGGHSHPIQLKTKPDGAIAAHTHKLNGAFITKDAGEHRHEIWAHDTDDDDSGAIEVGTPGGPTDQRLTGPDGTSGGHASLEVKPSGIHHHDIDSTGAGVDPAGAVPAHTHDIDDATKAVGTPDRAARTGPTLQYVKDLRISYDAGDITADVINFLQSRDGALVWDKLGDGSQTHALVTKGTDSIDLKQLGVDVTPGTHALVFSVVGGGGQIHYNLYIE